MYTVKASTKGPAKVFPNHCGISCQVQCNSIGHGSGFVPPVDRWQILTVAELGEHEAGNFLEGFEHSLALKSDGLDHRLILPAQLFLQSID